MLDGARLFSVFYTYPVAGKKPRCQILTVAATSEADALLAAQEEVGGFLMSTKPGGTWSVRDNKQRVSFDNDVKAPK